MAIVSYAPEFAKIEFRHPEIVDQDAYDNLVKLRRSYGRPLTLTDDGRLPSEAPVGASTTSLHYKGRAFDLRSKFMTEEGLFKFVWAAMTNFPTGMELELVQSPTDQHIHVGFFLDNRLSRLELRLE